MTRETLPGTVVLIAALSVAVVPVPAGATQRDNDTPKGAERAVALAVEAFEHAIGSRYDCVTEPSVRFEILAGRKGEYRPHDGSIAINPNRPVRTMPVTVVHELGHQFMVSCAIHGDVAFTEAFYAAQGLPAARSWFDYSEGWSNAPAEHFAEAIAWHTLGDTDGRIQLTEQTRELISELGSKEQSPKAMSGRSDGTHASKQMRPSRRGAADTRPTAVPLRSRPPVLKRTRARTPAGSRERVGWLS